MDIREFQKATFEDARDYILSKGIKTLRKDDDDFFCQILMSGCSDLEKKIELLLSAGVDVNAPTDGILNGFTPLATVVKKSENPIYLIELLFKNGANIEAPSQLGLTPLHCAIILQNLELAKYLIYKGANPNAVDENGNSCLMLALKCNDSYFNRRYHWPFRDIGGVNNQPVMIDIVENLFLSGASLGYKSQGWQGSSVLECAINAGDIKLVDWLISHGVKPTDNISSGSSKTLLMAACHSGALPVINYLIQLGATVDAVDQDGQTALFYHYSRDVKVAKALLDAGASLTHLDGNGHSLFQSRFLNVKIFEKYAKDFVRLGGDVDAKDAEGRNILHHLADHYDGLGAIKLAISLGCDVNAQDQNGTTPLMLARSEYWQELIAAGARVNDADANGDHALNLHLSSDLLEFGARVASTCC